MCQDCSRRTANEVVSHYVISETKLRQRRVPCMPTWWMVEPCTYVLTERRLDWSEPQQLTSLALKILSLLTSILFPLDWWLCIAILHRNKHLYTPPYKILHAKCKVGWSDHHKFQSAARKFLLSIQYVKGRNGKTFLGDGSYFLLSQVPIYNRRIWSKAIPVQLLVDG